MDEKPNIIILGAGIIGLSTAFYLSEYQSCTIHLVDPSPALFQGASGYAAGFLASDWFSASVAPLGELSFELHRQLAEKYDGAKRWGYSKSDSGSLIVRKGSKRGDDWLREGRSRVEATTPGNEKWDGPAWLRRGKGGEVERIGEGDTTAQVNPLKLCEFLLEKCRSRGVHVHFPYRCTKIDPSTSPSTLTISSVSGTSSEVTLRATHILFASGPWTSSAISALLPKRSYPRIPISSLAGHSLVVKSPRWVSAAPDTNTDLITAKGMPCHAIFTTDPASGHSPEIFSRSTGEIYIAGLNDASLALPEKPGLAEPDEKCIDVLKGWAERYLGSDEQGDLDDADLGRESDLTVLKTGLCFRPVSESGRPILDRVGVDDAAWKDVQVFVASGHGPWGISLSLGTGKVMSELILGKKTSCDITGLSLRR